MAFKVPILDKETGKTLELYTVDAKAHLDADPERYSAPNEEVAEVLKRKPAKKVSPKDVISGSSVDVTKPPPV